MPAGRKGKTKPSAAVLPVDVEEEFSCGEEADSPSGKSQIRSTAQAASQQATDIGGRNGGVSVKRLHVNIIHI